jgi:caffeoyl-CoA O-methyltransferase
MKSLAFLDSAIADYTVAHTSPPDELLRELHDETARRFGDDLALQIAPEQGPLLTMLTRLAGARDAVELGTFTGYSSICIARGLAPGGRLTCFDVSEEWTSVARRYWHRAGLADRIELRLGPAAGSLAALPEEETLDLAFIDADKPSYVTYYEALVPRMRPGGLILADNVLRHGEIVNAASPDPGVRVMREFNDRAVSDPRVTTVMLPLADGLTLMRKN